MTCEIVHGDMLDLLPRWRDDGFVCDTIISDPPYHLDSIAKRFGKEGSAPAKHGRDGAAARLSRGFMGSETDAGDISFRAETWKACIDVLKPGGRAAVFGGTRTWWKTVAAMDAAGFEIEDTIMWVYGQGLVLRRSRMKPCWEPVIVGRKNGGAVLDLNIEECRVPTDGSTDVGRWPGNLIHDGSAEVLSCFPDAPGQIANARSDGEIKSNHGIYGSLRHRQNEPSQDNRYTTTGATNFAAKPGARRLDSGSAARFFIECNFDADDEASRLAYHGKAVGAERVFRCGMCGEHAFRAERESHRHSETTLDHLLEHPTVKPASLMEHLARLLCPPGGLVLDPFCGTGSTGVGAMRAGRDCVLVERDANHCATARLRLSRG